MSELANQSGNISQNNSQHPTEQAAAQGAESAVKAGAKLGSAAVKALGEDYSGAVEDVKDAGKEAAKGAKNMAKSYGNAKMNANKDAENTSEELANTVKTAVKAGKVAAEVATGNFVKAAIDVAKDKNLRNLVLGIIAVVLIIPIMMFSLVPNVLFYPSEDAYSNNNKASLIDIIKGIFKKNDDSSLELSSIQGNDGNSTLQLMAVSNPNQDGSIENMLFDGMKNEKSLKVVADSDKSTTDFDVAPSNANATMQNMIKVTQDRYEKRHKALLNYTEKDFNSRKGGLKGTVTKNVNDPLSSGATTTGKEALKLMSLYSVQNDDEVKDKDFKDYRQWLGDEDSGFFFTEDAEGYDKWRYKPKKWKGSMLPQKQMDEAKAAKENGTYNESDYKDYYTSALGEVLTLKPEIDIQTTSVVSYDEEGNRIEEFFTTVTYSIDVKSVDDICENVVKFDEAVEKDENGNPSRIKGSSYREEYYKELVGDGEGQGVALEYFGVGGSGLYGGGASGSGATLVQIALGEVGYLEKASNSQLEDKTANAGSNNWTKYGAWFGLNGGPDAPWCNVFVSWCANQAGFCTSTECGDDNIIPKTAGTESTYVWYRNRGLIHNVSDSSYTPKPGDLVLRTPGSHGHIAIVEKLEDGVLYTIEGNTSGGVDVIAEGQGVCHKKYENPASRWTYYCDVQYPILSIDTGTYWQFDKYNLDESTIRWIATCVTGECGGADMIACLQEASQMANLHEAQYGKTGRDSASIRTTVKKRSSGGWYADTSWNRGCTDTAIQAVKTVFVEGKRYLPRFVTEHDCYELDIAESNSYAKNDPYFVQGQTQIHQKSDRFSGGGATYTFWCFMGSEQNGDVMGYYPALYEKYKEDLNNAIKP